MVVCHTTPYGIIGVTAVYVLIAFADYTTVKFVIELEDSNRWCALFRITCLDRYCVSMTRWVCVLSLCIQENGIVHCVVSFKISTTMTPQQGRIQDL